MAGTSMWDKLPEAIKQIINERIEKVAEEEYAEAVKRITERQKQVVAEVVISVAHLVSFEERGSEMRITVKNYDHK